MNKLTAYETGKAAEDQVTRSYAAKGYRVLARRWRGPAGEIDLVVEHENTVVFVEVKASRSFSGAVLNLSARQIRRIYASAAGFLGFMPTGQNTNSRFDVALVNRLGQLEVIENAICP